MKKKRMKQKEKMEKRGAGRRRRKHVFSYIFFGLHIIKPLIHNVCDTVFFIIITQKI